MNIEEYDFITNWRKVREKLETGFVYNKFDKNEIKERLEIIPGVQVDEEEITRAKIFEILELELQKSRTLYEMGDVWGAIDLLKPVADYVPNVKIVKPGQENQSKKNNQRR